MGAVQRGRSMRLGCMFLVGAVSRSPWTRACMHLGLPDARARTPLLSLQWSLSLLPLSCQTVQVDAMRSGAELRRKNHGTKPTPCKQSSCQRHAENDLDLGVNDHGVETYNLGVNYYGAKLSI